MRKIVLFMLTTLDGYFEGENHDISWHNVDGEFNQFAAQQMQEAGVLLFGRRTYELMEGYWPTAKATDLADQIVMDQMNSLPKIVFSRTLKAVSEKENWKNVTLHHKVDMKILEKLKAEDGKDIVVLGSSNLCVSLLKEGLLDEARIMINPVVIGKGTPLFAGIDEKVELILQKEKRFNNGNILLYYHIVT